MDILNQVLDFMQLGFTKANAPLGIVIALIAAYLLNSWKRLWFIALGAVLVHVVVEALIPVVTGKGKLQLPPNLLEPSYWRQLAALYVGYLIIVAVFYLLKTMLFRRGHAAAH